MGNKVDKMGNKVDKMGSFVGRNISSNTHADAFFCVDLTYLSPESKVNIQYGGDVGYTIKRKNNYKFGLRTKSWLNASTDYAYEIENVRTALTETITLSLDGGKKHAISIEGKVNLSKAVILPIKFIGVELDNNGTKYTLPYIKVAECFSAFKLMENMSDIDYNYLVVKPTAYEIRLHDGSDDGQYLSGDDRHVAKDFAIEHEKLQKPRLEKLKQQLEETKKYEEKLKQLNSVKLELFKAAKKANKNKVVELLDKFMPEIKSCVDENGYTALHWSAWKGSLEVTKMCLVNGV